MKKSFPSGAKSPSGNPQKNLKKNNRPSPQASSSRSPNHHNNNNIKPINQSFHNSPSKKPQEPSPLRNGLFKKLTVHHLQRYRASGVLIYAFENPIKTAHFDSDNQKKKCWVLLGCETRKKTKELQWLHFGGKKEDAFEICPEETALREMHEETGNLFKKLNTPIDIQSLQKCPKNYYESGKYIQYFQEIPYDPLIPAHFQKVVEEIGNSDHFRQTQLKWIPSTALVAILRKIKEDKWIKRNEQKLKEENQTGEDTQTEGAPTKKEEASIKKEEISIKTEETSTKKEETSIKKEEISTKTEEASIKKEESKKEEELNSENLPLASFFISMMQHESVLDFFDQLQKEEATPVTIEEADPVGTLVSELSQEELLKYKTTSPKKNYIQKKRDVDPDQKKRDINPNQNHKKINNQKHSQRKNQGPQKPNDPHKQNPESKKEEPSNK